LVRRLTAQAVKSLMLPNGAGLPDAFPQSTGTLAKALYYARNMLQSRPEKSLI